MPVWLANADIKLNTNTIIFKIALAKELGFGEFQVRECCI
jgi:hypothetical protein